MQYPMHITRKEKVRQDNINPMHLTRNCALGAKIHLRAENTNRASAKLAIAIGFPVKGKCVIGKSVFENQTLLRKTCQYGYHVLVKQGCIKASNYAATYAATYDAISVVLRAVSC